MPFFDTETLSPFRVLFKNHSEICEFESKVVFARKYANLEPLFCLKKRRFVSIIYLLHPPELLYWGYYVIVLGVQRYCTGVTITFL